MMQLDRKIKNWPPYMIKEYYIGRRKEAIAYAMAENYWFYSVCAFCEEGGRLLRCQGPCRRAFHPTKRDGSTCDSLGFTLAEAREIKNFYCKNCKYNQHQCFSCGKLGYSGNVIDAEVIKCAYATCNRFYHPECVAKLLPKVVEHVAREDKTNVADPKSFTCPVHFCCVCKEVENPKEPELTFAVCARCPKSYHKKCLPREIIGDFKGLMRRFEGLLPNKRLLLYCMNHELDEELWIPTRDHIKFPEPLDCGEDSKSSSLDAEFSKLRVDAAKSD